MSDQSPAHEITLQELAEAHALLSERVSLLTSREFNTNGRIALLEGKVKRIDNTNHRRFEIVVDQDILLTFVICVGLIVIGLVSKK